MNLTNYIKEIQKELKLTTFPSQAVVINFTVFVIVFTAVMAAFLGALDLGFGEAIIEGINALKGSDALNNGIVATTTIATSSLDVLQSATSVTPNILQ